MQSLTIFDFLLLIELGCSNRFLHKCVGQILLGKISIFDPKNEKALTSPGFQSRSFLVTTANVVKVFLVNMDGLAGLAGVGVLPINLWAHVRFTSEL